MKTTNQRFRLKDKGFALIATISVMVLLVMISLAMLSLSTVELRSSSQSALDMARANARLALTIAIGELQSSAGPDQRITANSDVIDDNRAQPNILGVWNSYTNETPGVLNIDSSSIDYDVRKEDDFIQWLCSTSQDNKTNLAYTNREPEDDIELVDAGTLNSSDDASYISASMVDVPSSDSNTTGKYAWAVIDESQKIQLTLNNADQDDDAGQIAALNTPGKPGFSVKSDYDVIDELSDENRGKLLSVESTELVSFDQSSTSAFNFLTTESKSLLVDVVNGGFQKDLSLLFNEDSLPSEYDSRYIYSESNTPVVSAPSRYNGARPIPSPDPLWSQLYSHYKLYDRVANEGAAYGVQTSTDQREEGGSFFEEQQLLPVISNAQFIFSLSPQEQNNAFFLSLWTDVALTLWNPYNVNLTVNGLEVDMHRLPLEMQFYDEFGTSLTSNEWVHFANTFASDGDNNADGHIRRLPFRMRIPQTFTLAPGEFRVFGDGANSSFPWRGLLFTEGIQLNEGFALEDPSDSSGEGLTTRVVAVDANGSGLHDSFDGKQNRQQITQEDPTMPGVGDKVYRVAVRAAAAVREPAPIETNGEITAFLKIYTGQASADGEQLTTEAAVDGALADFEQQRTYIGSIEVNIPAADLEDHLPTFPLGELADLRVEGGEAIVASQSNSDDKQPFLVTSIRLKTEEDINQEADNNSSIWIHNGITNSYFTNGIEGDQDVDPKNLAYEITWEELTSTSNNAVQIDSDNIRGFGATGVTQETGLSYAPFLQVPLTPATSIAQLSHAPINSSGLAPLTSQVIGNSFGTLSIPLEDKTQRVSNLGTSMVDPSYMANQTLFDGYFFSTVAEGSSVVEDNAPQNVEAIVQEFADGTRDLKNNNFVLADTAITEIFEDDDTAFENIASYIYNKGAFNVNSTSVEAWELFLASGSQESLLIMDALTASNSFSESSSSEGYAFSRFSLLLGDEVGADSGESRWLGHRRLTANQISDLAENIVEEVKARGPFQSIAEFVNRRLTTDTETGTAGAIQTAINNSNINASIGESAPTSSSEINGAGSGFTGDGSPSHITQADILNRLAPSITVRGDTFKIRAYGEATIDGQTTGAWCEATVQRTHDFVDSAQEPTTEYTEEELSETNFRLGRQFEIVSFKWLAESEI